MATDPCTVFSRSSCDALLESVRRAWPGKAPGLDAGSLDALLSDPTGVLEDLGSPALVLFDEGESASYRVVDAFLQCHTPAVLVFPDLDSRTKRLEGNGVLVFDRSIEASSLAMALHALRERQGCVRELAQELRISQTTQGGMLGHMERINEEMHLAATVQQEFLPRALPEIDGVDMGVLFRPADYVSGDIYDVVRLDDEHLAFLIADAVGHGVPAALLTMVISKSLRKMETVGGVDRIVDPAVAVQRLNVEMTRRRGDTNRFATGVYGILNTRTMEATIAGAGHPPPLHVRGGKVEYIESEGPLLGVFEEAEFSSRTVQLAPGDTLLLYSDGFEVAFPDEDADEHQAKLPTLEYIEHLTHLAGESDLPRAMRMLDEKLDAQRGSLHQADDVTALAISIGEAGAVRRAA